MVVVYEGGSGMEPTARIVVVDCSVVDGGDGGKEPTASIIVVDDSDVNHCRLQWRLIAAAVMMTIIEDGRH